MGKNAFQRFLQKLNNPPNWIALIATATALIALPLSILTLLFDKAHKAQATVACIVSGIIFLYAVLVIVNSLLRLRNKVLNVADRYEFTRNLHFSYEFRTIFFGACALLGNLCYTVFLAVMAFLYDSVWYGALAVYYIVLLTSQGGVLLQNNKDEKRYKFDFHSLQKAKAGTYRYCGIMMLALAAALAVSVVNLVVNGTGTKTAGGFIFFFAAVAAYKVINAVVNFIRSSKRVDMVVRSVQYINFAVTLVSVLTLQTVILSAYPTAIEPAVFNGITGAIVCACTLALGAFMILHSIRAKRRIFVQATDIADAILLEDDGYNRDGYKDEYNKEN
jgi:hypothetical protein